MTDLENIVRKALLASDDFVEHNGEIYIMFNNIEISPKIENSKVVGMRIILKRDKNTIVEMDTDVDFMKDDWVVSCQGVSGMTRFTYKTENMI